MPVSLLLCEGAGGSPDIRVLRSILVGINLTLEPSGSKYGLGAKIRSYREVIINSVIAGIRDSDFDRDHVPPTGNLREWRIENDSIWLGWYWERIEIENYLTDPIVVEHALGTNTLDMNAYRVALQDSAESIAEYMAARMALSRSRIQFSPLPNHWGEAGGLKGHTFPAERNETVCRSQIGIIVADYSQRIQESEVLERFEAMLLYHRPGGSHFQHPEICFSGKDILCGMRTALEGMGFASPGVFRERVLKGIETSPDDVWTWLPEWDELRNQIISASSN